MSLFWKVNQHYPLNEGKVSHSLSEVPSCGKFHMKSVKQFTAYDH